MKVVQYILKEAENYWKGGGGGDDKDGNRKTEEQGEHESER